MKLRNFAAIASVLSLCATANAQLITSFPNLDFDSGVTHIATGFDAPGADIDGWSNHMGIFDAGVEGPGAWWGPYENQAAFINGGGSAYNLSDYTIQSGDLFTIEFYADSWEWTEGNGEWTISLFYNDPANVFGSYTTPALDAETTAWKHYFTESPIAATPAAEGGKLGILIANTGQDIAQIDEIMISVVPEPTTFSLIGLAGLGMLFRRRLVK